jgi:phosphate transport system substrate-binding protein
MATMSNQLGVSPIVATLVLIVVAVIGSVVVGTIMGTFSTGVSNNVNANQAASASQTEIVVGGLDTVNIITQAEGAAYTANHPSVKIVSRGSFSGNGAAVNLLHNGVTDIAAMSAPFGGGQAYGTMYNNYGPAPVPLAPQWLTNNPNLQSTMIGVSFVVPITNHANPVNVSGMEFSQGDFRMLFNASGEETFS